MNFRDTKKKKEGIAQQTAKQNETAVWFMAKEQTNSFIKKDIIEKREISAEERTQKEKLILNLKKILGGDNIRKNRGVIAMIHEMAGVDNLLDCLISSEMLPLMEKAIEKCGKSKYEDTFFIQDEMKKLFAEIKEKLEPKS